MKRKKRASSFLTGVLLLVMLFGVGMQLYRMQEKLNDARSEADALAAQITQMEKENAALEEDLAHASDPELIEQIARDQLGMVVQDEKVFYTIGG